jgi:hypothetical protein
MTSLWDAQKQAAENVHRCQADEELAKTSLWLNKS